ncbi:hypothetical protein MA16_Dca009533 [Dendrobium catenatum]|uniref:Uncharacterized protein n=1 Tax=Dendrobium catenatum TaxID=906689 RepID=A0A2I0VRX0_9ASPA|nr:hypothetical protein MA16_Dca009533 [Dendrobium catenatum]
MASAVEKKRENFEEAMKASTTCMPRKRRRGSRPASPSSVLVRLREVFMKLVMFSTMSKAGGSSSGGGSSSSTRRSGVVPKAGPPRHLDSYQIEAVEECIEFFKTSASASPRVKDAD